MSALTAEAPIHVLVVVATRLYREGLLRALGATDRLLVTGGAADSAEAVACLRRETPDVVLLDMAIALDRAALEATVEAARPAPVVALGAAREEAVIACAEAGVAGYVDRGASLEACVEVLESAVRGELLVAPWVAGALLRHVGDLAHGDRDSGPARLTDRETQIMRLVDEGMSNQQIAHRLGIQIGTVKNHVHNVLEKLHLDRRQEAAAHVRRLSDANQVQRIDHLKA